VTELDDASAELRAARAELRAELLLAAEWARMNAPEDPVAALITERVSAAFDRVRCAGIARVTAIRDHSAP
jgi:hypothetical protein